jgi:hypothetical protein
LLRCRTVLKRDSNSTNLTSDHPYRAPAVTCELLHLGGWVGLASLMIWVLGPPPCKAGRAGTHPFCSCTLATFECFQINFNFGGADARRLTGGGPAPQTTAAVECPTLWSTHLNRFEPPRSYCASVRCPTSQFQIYLKVGESRTPIGSLLGCHPASPVAKTRLSGEFDSRIRAECAYRVAACRYA